LYNSWLPSFGQIKAKSVIILAMEKPSQITPWQVVEQKQVFKKYSRQIDRIDYKMPDGSLSDCYIISQPPAAATVALTTDNKVILVRQFRPGPNKILTELPGGFIDPGEKPICAAKREFTEETGYTGDFEYVACSFTDAYSTFVRHCCVAKNCVKIGEAQNSSTEQTQVTLMTIKGFRAHLQSGQLTSSEVGYMGLDYLGLL
jgi:ADP-ribose pyrophosphatase